MKIYLNTELGNNSLFVTKLQLELLFVRNYNLISFFSFHLLEVNNIQITNFNFDLILICKYNEIYTF